MVRENFLEPLLVNSTLNNFLRMIFVPIADGGGNCHVARIGGFVVLRQFFGRAVAD